MAGPAPLDVWLYGVRVARVTERRTGRFQLEYTADAFARWPRGGPLLSVSLPLVPGRLPPSAVGAFLDGLVPEGEARTLLEARYGVRRGDLRGLLAEIGRDCAGAVVIVPADAPPPAEVVGHPEPISAAELAREVRLLPERPLGDDDRVRVSLAGQQAKLLLVEMPDGGWARPIGGYPSTHVLKPGDHRYPAMAANEALCLRVARELALTSVDIELIDVEGAPALIVSRYDRQAGPAGVDRIHQEDACQALAVDTGPLGAGKYEASGGPSFVQVADVLDVHNGDGEQTLRLAAVMAFTVAVGNADAHGKNLSLVHPPRGPLHLAPLYDVVCTVLYREVVAAGAARPVSSALAMRIAGVDDIHDVTVDDLRREAGTWHHGGGVAERIAAVLAALPGAIEIAAKATPEAPAELSELLAARVERLRAGQPAGRR